MFLKKRSILILICGILLAGFIFAPAHAEQKVSFMLDWYPNPDHVPLYAAKALGFFSQVGIDADLIVPADPNDPLKLVAAGKIDFAISYQPSVLIAASKDLPVVSIGSLIQHPLSTILYLKSSGIKTPADFKGKKIGYSVEPLYRVLFEAVAEHSGLKPSEYETIRVGFNMAPVLLSGKVDAVAGAFRNYEAIQIELEGKEVGIFPLEENGVPDFYELVIITHADTIKNKPELVSAFMKAVTKGIDYTVKNPQKSFQAFLKLNSGLKDELNRRAYKATLPFFKGSPAQDPARWTEMQDFMFERGLIKKKTPVSKLILK